MDDLFDDTFSAFDVESLFATSAQPPASPAVEPPPYTHAYPQVEPPPYTHAYPQVEPDEDIPEYLPAQPPARAQAVSADFDQDPLLDGLNPPQREAVIHWGSPVLVVAGAGSGKTRVLTRRIAYLIGRRNVHPGSILAITFTNKAAAEMRERVDDLVGNQARFMWVATFHSACVRILRADIDKLGMSKSFSIYDDADSKRLVGSILKERNIDQKKFPVRMIRSWISDQKNALVGPEQAMEMNTSFPQDLFAEVYVEYQLRLRRAEALDFDDLLMTTVHLLRDFPQVRDHYRRRFRHVLVDEYQDTNQAQYVMIHLLCTAGDDGLAAPELLVVGDSDQSIYAFRGASIQNILNFNQDFPGAATIQLEQNYRSTQNILSAANALIQNNTGRPEKNLWTDAGEGAKITGYVADTEHDEARFIADEVARLSAAGESRYSDTAVFYRTNAQSRAIEEVFVRMGLPYKIVGGVKFYERREVRDAIAYLRALANPADDVSVERILNVPKRGIGATTEEVVRSYARSASIPMTTALEQASSIPGLGARALTPLTDFAEVMARHRAMVAEGAPADEVLTSILDQSGYVESLKSSGDPQDETRLENLAELIRVAREFVSQAHEIDITPGDELTHDDDPLAGDDAAWISPGASGSSQAVPGSAATLFEIPGQAVHDPGHTASFEDGVSLLGAPEPDDSLAAFLERIALSSDSDEIPGVGEGTVTLMTLHTAKGLEFDTVFVTGFEDGLFPHERTHSDPSQMEEERRLAYVGLTRARKRLYITRATVRTMWGTPSYNPPSRFLAEIPEILMDWRRLDRVATWDVSSRTSAGHRSTSSPSAGSSRGSSMGSSTSFQSRSTTARPKKTPVLAAGDQVLHTTFGLGTVKAVTGSGDQARAEVDFGSYGVKLLSVIHAPIEKL